MSRVPGWPFPDLPSFLRFCEQRGQVLRIKEEIEPYLEASAIAQECVRRNGPVLIFENIRGARFPLVMNLFGTMDRVVWALGREPDAIARELLDLVHTVRQPPRWSNVRSLARAGWRVFRSFPRRVRRAPVHQIIEEPDLRKFPVITCWPEDGGPFITFGLVLTSHPVAGTRNLGLYRMHVYDEKTTGMHWQSMKGGRGHYFEAEKRGKALPVAVILGADPILMMSAILPLPEELDEILWAGILRGRGVPLVRARSIPLEVPAHAEIVLEGFVPPGERRTEGPFGDHFGHYSEAHPFPVFHIKTITRKRNPVYPASVVGKPPQEDWALGVAAGEMVGPLIKVIYPSIVRMWAYPEAGFHHLLVVSVEEHHPMEATKIGLGLLGQGQLSLTKCLILVPPSVDPSNWQEVMTHLWHHFLPERGLNLLGMAPADTLDFTSGTLHVGSKVLINALGEPVRKEAPPADLPFEVRDLDDEILEGRVWYGGSLVLKLKSHRKAPEILKKLLRHPEVRSKYLWVFAVSDDISLDDPILLLWGIFTRFDPGRDWIFGDMGWEGARPIYRSPIGVDATWKPFYPKPLVMPEPVMEKARSLLDRYLKK